MIQSKPTCLDKAMTTPTEETTKQPENQPGPQKEPPARPDSPMAEVRAFRRFATPVLVQIAFWVGALVFLVIGINTIEAADRGWAGTDTAMVWAGLLTIFLGPVILRIAGELILVVFRINEQIQELKERND